MNRKTTEKERALALRLEGLSLSQISKILGVSKSSISLWVRGMNLPEEAVQRITAKRNDAREHSARTHKTNTDKRIASAHKYAQDIVSGFKVTGDYAKLLCALLYWCEGVKIRRSNTFGFTNSDPNLVALFMRLFRENFELDESKFRLMIHLHEYHDESLQLQFWSNVTNIPLLQCYPPYRKPHTAKRTREGYPGCVCVRYFDIEVARRLESIAIVFLEKGP
jgi:transcriptional regulator with XRE-family HTH domain